MRDSRSPAAAVSRFTASQTGPGMRTHHAWFRCSAPALRGAVLFLSAFLQLNRLSGFFFPVPASSLYPCGKDHEGECHGG